MSKLEAKELVPELRFPEFQGSAIWKRVNLYEQLLDVFDFRGRTPKKLGMDWGAGNIISLSANNVKNGYIDFSAECNLASEELYQKWMGGVDLRKNDIVFTMEAPLGKALLIPDNQKYILSQRVIAFKTKRTIRNDFLIQLIWSDYFQSQINTLSTGSTAKGINQKTLKTININIPSSINEQGKVADCLSSMDDLITANTKKLESLKSHKKGLMQKLFPAERKSVPELRFSGFDGDWEVKSFSKLFEIGGGRDHQHLSNGGIPVYGSGGYMRSVNEYLYDGKSACIGRKGTINKPIFLTGKFWTVDTLFYTHSFIECSPEFIYLLFQNIDWLKLNEAGGVPSLSKVIIKKIEKPIPKDDEQKAIVNIIFSVDKLIEMQEVKIDTLTKYKKGLMQRLFPSVEGVTA